MDKWLIRKNNHDKIDSHFNADSDCSGVPDTQFNAGATVDVIITALIDIVLEP